MKRVEEWLTPGVVLALGIIYFISVMVPVMLSDIR